MSLRPDRWGHHLGGSGGTGQKSAPNAYIEITDGTGSGAVLQLNCGPTVHGTATAIRIWRHHHSVTVVAGGSGYHSPTSPFGAIFHGALTVCYTFTPTLSAGAITSVAVTSAGTGPRRLRGGVFPA
jgi:hypothetical protein